VHPQHVDRCLKIHRPERTPTIRRQSKPFPGSLRPLRYFDENWGEAIQLKRFWEHYPEAIKKHLPRSYGTTETNLGSAHETDLIRDMDGRIAQSLEQYIWEHGIDSIAQKAIQEFTQNWITHPPKTRDLIPHNMVLQHTATGSRIRLIDGLGRPPTFSFFSSPCKLSQSRATKRIRDLENRLEMILKAKEQQSPPPKYRLDGLNRNA